MKDTEDDIAKYYGTTSRTLRNWKKGTEGEQRRAAALFWAYEEKESSVKEKLEQLLSRDDLEANFALLLDLAKLEIENEQSLLVDDELFDNREIIEKIRGKIKG